MLVIICAKYKKNSSRTLGAAEQTPEDVQYFNTSIAVIAE